MKVSNRLNKLYNLASCPREVEIRYSMPYCQIIHNTEFGKSILFAKRS